MFIYICVCVCVCVCVCMYKITQARLISRLHDGWVSTQKAMNEMHHVNRRKKKQKINMISSIKIEIFDNIQHKFLIENS